jgi:hypothetical protein
MYEAPHYHMCKSEDFPESWGIFIFVRALLSWENIGYGLKDIYE